MLKKVFSGIIIAIIISLAIIFVVLPSQTNKNTLNNVLDSYSLRFDTGSDFNVLRNFSYQARDETYNTIIAQKEDTRIEIELIRPLNKLEGEDYINSKYKIIHNLYGPQLMPYSGPVTRSTSSPESTKIEETTTLICGNRSKVLFANATDRYILGVTDETLIKQKAVFAAIYDAPSQTYYQIIIFRPFENFEKDKPLKILKKITFVRQ